MGVLIKLKKEEGIGKQNLTQERDQELPVMIGEEMIAV